MTAHPRLDPRTGEMFFFAYSVFEPVIRYYVVDADGVLVHRATIDVPAPVMMHDFVITEHHAVFLDSPIVFDMENLGKGPMVQWRPENGTRIGVHAPASGRPTTCAGSRSIPGTCSTSGTAGWTATASSSPERGSTHPDFGIDATAPLDESTADQHPAHPARFWVDLAAGKAGWEQIDDLGGDFDRVNDEFNGVRSRYHYMSAAVGPGASHRRLRHHREVRRCQTGAAPDLERRARADTSARACSLPIPTGRAEDDGWLVNAVYDSATDAHRRLCARRPRCRRRTHRHGAPAPTHALRLPRQLVPGRWLNHPNASTVASGLVSRSSRWWRWGP